jgi:hypothetical protein
MLRRKVAVIVILFASFTIGGWMLNQDIQEARSTETRNRPIDDISIVHTYELPSKPMFRSREYVKIIRLQENHNLDP